MRLNLSLTHASRWIHTDLTFSFDDVKSKNKTKCKSKWITAPPRSQKYFDQSDNIPGNPKVLTVVICIVIVNINRWYFSIFIRKLLSLRRSVFWSKLGWAEIEKLLDQKLSSNLGSKTDVNFISYTQLICNFFFHNLQISKSAWNLFVISQICDTFPPGWELSCHLCNPPLFSRVPPFVWDPNASNPALIYYKL